MAWNRKMAAALAVLLAAGTLLSACGGSETTGNTQEHPAAETPAETQEQTADAEESAAADEAEPAGETEGVAETEDPEKFVFYMGAGIGDTFYTNFNENPVMRYVLQKVWDADGDGAGRKVEMEYIIPSDEEVGTYLTTLIATGEYPDLINMSYAQTNAATMYEEGALLDLTEYVEKYMPNYQAWMAQHPEYDGQLTNDGKYLMLYNVMDSPREPWGGYNYRRDWLVKYGTNPETGEAFTGGWNEDKTEWTDDVVFPSGGTDPVYISDWEWMLDILQTAVEDQGLDAAGGYAMQMPYTGYVSTGSLTSSFGDSTIGNYLSLDGTAKQGYNNASARAYIQCMNHWYEEGWIDPMFEERSSDPIWFSIDMEGVYAGRVGMWYGLLSQLGNGMDLGDEATKDICVYGAQHPINDVYGDDSCKNVEPRVFYADQLASTGISVSISAKDKDLPTLFTYLDYFYGEEGALLRTFGFSDEQQAEIQDPFYAEWDMDGTYTVEERDGESWYLVNPEREKEEGLDVALCGERGAPGMRINHNVDMGYELTIAHGVQQWAIGSATGSLVMSPISNALTSEESEDWGNKQAQIMTYLSQEIPNFITGRKDIDDDAAWQEYVDQLTAFGCDSYAEYINNHLGK